ncbi:MAG: GNAT family N-acetyltransferase [Gemmatimonadales bacterium]|nr:GNAT family N-acetyltransferase [Gemmatimonadales bacterium]MDQ3426763.1 GNAT family N-acetyltransferase [Gemmatimonadota bacterium]
MPPIVRRGTPDDAARITEFAARVFRDAFEADNRPEDVVAHLAATFTPERQSAELRDPSWTTLLMEEAAEPAGYAQLRQGPAPACVTGPNPVELVRFYVDRRWHGRGNAQSLMASVLVAASEMGETLWLSVWERNARAMAFYRKSGFVDVGSKIFRLGGDAQSDRVVARSLRD